MLRADLPVAAEYAAVYEYYALLEAGQLYKRIIRLALDLERGAHEQRRAVECGYARFEFDIAQIGKAQRVVIPLIHKRLSQTYAFGYALTVHQIKAVVGAAHVFHQYVKVAALARHGDFDLRLLIVAILYAHELAVHIDVSAVVYVLQHNG